MNEMYEVCERLNDDFIRDFQENIQHKSLEDLKTILDNIDTDLSNLDENKSYSTKFYRDFRQSLLSFVAMKSRIGRVSCSGCGKEYSLENNNTLEFHHLDREKGLKEKGFGGKNHLYKLRKQLLEGVKIVVLCKDCHKLEHVSDGCYYKNLE